MKILKDSLFASYTVEGDWTEVDLTKRIRKTTKLETKKKKKKKKKTKKK